LFIAICVNGNRFGSATAAANCSDGEIWQETHRNNFLEPKFQIDELTPVMYYRTTDGQLMKFLSFGTLSTGFIDLSPPVFRVSALSLPLQQSFVCFRFSGQRFDVVPK
jgi:hypothetical protein